MSIRAAGIITSESSLVYVFCENLTWNLGDREEKAERARKRGTQCLLFSESVISQTVIWHCSSYILPVTVTLGLWNKRQVKGEMHND